LLYRAVIFDLLTALLDSWTLWNEVAGSDEDGLRWRRAYLRLTYECGGYQPYETLVATAAHEAGLSPDLADQLVASWAGLKPWDDVADVLAGLRQKNIKLGVATNCSSRLTQIAVSAVGGEFAAVSCAEEVGFYKPRPEPYLSVLAKLGIDPGQTLFVAGSAADVPGATRVGMPVFWHNRAGLALTHEAARPIAVSDKLKPLLDFV
jgi:2-haloacid dehalogenase